VLGLAAASSCAGVLGSGRRPRCAPTSTCSPASGPTAPRLPAAPIYEARRRPRPPLARSAKLAQVREAMARPGASTIHLPSSVDDIAWLRNLRGADVAPTTPCSWPTCW